MDPEYVKGLKEAKHLVDQGILSEDEFKEEKRRLSVLRDEREKISQSNGAKTKAVQDGSSLGKFPGREDAPNLNNKEGSESLLTRQAMALENKQVNKRTRKEKNEEPCQEVQDCEESVASKRELRGKKRAPDDEDSDGKDTGKSDRHKNAPNTTENGVETASKGKELILIDGDEEEDCENSKATTHNQSSRLGNKGDEDTHQQQLPRKRGRPRSTKNKPEEPENDKDGAEAREGDEIDNRDNDNVSADDARQEKEPKPVARKRGRPPSVKSNTAAKEDVKVESMADSGSKGNVKDTNASGEESEDRGDSLGQKPVVKKRGRPPKAKPDTSSQASSARDGVQDEKEGQSPKGETSRNKDATKKKSVQGDNEHETKDDNCMSEDDQAAASSKGKDKASLCRGAMAKRDDGSALPMSEEDVAGQSGGDNASSNGDGRPGSSKALNGDRSKRNAKFKRLRVASSGEDDESHESAGGVSEDGHMKGDSGSRSDGSSSNSKVANAAPSVKDSAKRKGKAVSKGSGGTGEEADNDDKSAQQESEDEDVVRRDWRERSRGKSRIEPKGTKAKLRQELSDLGVDLGELEGMSQARHRSAKAKVQSGFYNEKAVEKVIESEEDEEEGEDGDASVGESGEESEDDSDEGVAEDEESEEEDQWTEFGTRKKEKILSLKQHSKVEETKKENEEEVLVLSDSDDADKKKKKQSAKKGRGKKKEQSSESEVSDEPARKRSGKGAKSSKQQNQKKKKKKISSSESESEGESESEEEPVRGRVTRGRSQKQAKETSGDKAGGGKGGSSKKRRRLVQKGSSSGSGSDEDGEGKSSGGGSDSDNSAKGNKRKRIRKPAKLGADILQMAREGREAEEHRSEIKTTAERQLGKVLVLVRPQEGEGGKSVDVTIPESISKHLQAHQRAGVEFAWDCLVKEGKGCILAHCMGLGKSLQVVSLIYAMLLKEDQQSSDREPVMIVAPVNTLANWSKEFDKWLPEDDTSPTIFQLTDVGTTADRIGMIEEWHESGGILIIGYEQYRNLAKAARVRNKKQKELLHKYLVAPGPSLVVCDEGHVLRNVKSGIAQALRQINTRKRLILSGTPLQNNLKEYHCMVDFVRPNLLGTEKTFKRDFIDPILNGQCVDSTPLDVKQMRSRSFVLHGLLKGCVDRADYRVLKSYLPPKYEFVIGIRMSKLQCDLYNHYLQTLSAGGTAPPGNVRAKVFEAYHSLAKVWTHPGVLAYERSGEYTSRRYAKKYDSMDDFIATSESDAWSDEEDKKKKRKKAAKDKEKKKLAEAQGEGDDAVEEVKEENDWWTELLGEVEAVDEEGSGKLMFLMQVLEEAGECNDKVLVFSQSLLLLDTIENTLESAGSKGKGPQGGSWKLGRDYFRLDGSTDSQTRQDWIDKFNDPKSKKARLFLISTRAGGLGVNLVSANRVVLMDASWNPSHDKQAIFRAYRFGQTKPVYIYRLLAHGTMEQKIYGRQVTKQALAARVVDSEETGRHFTAEELAQLFEFTPGECAEDVEKVMRGVTNKSYMEVRAVAASSQAATSAQGSSSSGRDGAAKVDGDDAVCVETCSSSSKAAVASSSSKLWEGVGIPPADTLLARVLSKLLPKWVVGYHEADSLIEVEADLSPDEVEAAWAEYRAHEEKMKQEQRTVSRPTGATSQQQQQQYQQAQPGASAQGELQRLQLHLMNIRRERDTYLTAGKPLRAGLDVEERLLLQRIAAMSTGSELFKVQLQVPRLDATRSLRVNHDGILYNVVVPDGVLEGQIIEVQFTRPVRPT